MLCGRDAEITAVERLLEQARSGRSATLTLVGDAGIGKTALLEHLADSADGFRVLRCSGVQSEAEIPFAALHVLLRPLLGLIGALPTVQADALRAAFGLAERPAADRFLVGLATLSLMAEAAGDEGLLCLVDDAHWLDRESGAALAFACRRLEAEGIVVVFATRGTGPGEEGVAAPGQMLRLTGLDDASVRALVDRIRPALAPHARDRLVAMSGGNPLAVLELAAALDHAPLAEQTTPLVIDEGASPVAGRIVAAFARQIADLPARTGRLLLIAAADDTGDVSIILTAAQRLGTGLADLVAAERAGLVRVSGETLTFRHPLIRSAVYDRSSMSDRIAAHRALAGALDPGVHPDRHAWHLAAASVVPDEDVAAELERVGDRALRRGTYAAGAAAYEKAARLTADPAKRGRLLAAAADTARSSGQLASADQLAAVAIRSAADPDTSARAIGVMARVEFERGDAGRACELMVSGARKIAGHDPERAARNLAVALRMAYFGNDAAAAGATADAIESLRMPRDHPLRPMLAATAIVGRLIGGTSIEDVPPLRAVVRDMPFEPLGVPADGTFTQVASLRLLIGDAEKTADHMGRIVTEARERGLIGGLTHMLLVLAEAALAAGRLREALAAGTEGLRIAEDTGQEHSANNLRGMLARITALTGDEETCVGMAEAALRYAGAHRTSTTAACAAIGLCVHDLARRRYASAYDRLHEHGPELRRHPYFTFLTPPDEIEAAVRSGRADRAVGLLEPYEAFAARHQDRPVAHAIAARCRALLSPDDQADVYYQEALRLHERIDRSLPRARTELLYGEWLRRAHRRNEARGHLRWALRAYERAGATVWAERARSELRTTGETIAAADQQRQGLNLLTPQELQVARLAANGLTNRDIGARLFLSPRTVGYHLYKIFPKLGIASRAELTRLVLD